MTAATFRGEIRFAFAGIPDEHARSFPSKRRRRALSLDRIDNASDVSGDRIRVRVAQTNRWHAHVATAAVDDRNDQFAVLVAQSNL